MQGTAAAYDLVKFMGAEHIRFGDADLAQADRAAKRVNALIGREVCEARQVSALEQASLRSFLDGTSVVLSCVPYWMHPKVAPVAISCGVSMVDMGGNTQVSRETLALDSDAKAAGVTIVPDTGLAPGLVNNLAGYMIEMIDDVESVRLYCGGLPQHPKPPFNYKLLFNVEGLVTEYCGDAEIIREGQIAYVPTLTELEEVDFAGLGKMEAFATSGGTSTAPETWRDKVRTYEYKTVRFPGHCALMKLFKDYGFWGLEPVPVRSGTAVPREVFASLMSPALKDDSDRDQVLVRAVGVGKSKKVQIDIHQLHDEATGFSAMEQLTGCSTSIYAAVIASGDLPKGCLRYETAVSGKRFVEELKRRPINLSLG